MFLYPAILFGLGLMAIPVLIHLINLFRHKPVDWAAMEFLLASYRKHSRWIRFKELLLLLLRVAAVGLAVLAAASPLISDRWGNLFSSRQQHVVFLLDDSWSMQTRLGDGDCFQQGKNLVEQSCQAERQTAGTIASLYCFSQPDKPLFTQEPVNQEFQKRLKRELGRLSISQRDSGPATGLTAIVELVRANSQQSSRVCIVSDFRARNWLGTSDKLNPELKKQLGELAALKAQIYFLDVSGQSYAGAGPNKTSGSSFDADSMGDSPTADVSRSKSEKSGAEELNLGIRDLSVSDGAVAAGVPIPLAVEIQNFSSAPVRNVGIRLDINGVSVPSVLIQEIPAGQMRQERFCVSVPQGGRYTVTARLSPDVLELDNSRQFVLEVPDRQSVLLVGSGRGPRCDLAVDKQPDVRFVQAALAPGGSVDTGIGVQLEDSRFLNTGNLTRFQTVYLLNVDQISGLGGENLYKWLRQGGTAVAFLGDQIDPISWNNWLDKSPGLSGLKLGPVKSLQTDYLRRRADLNVTPCPLFRIFEGQNNSFLSAIRVQTYYQLAQPVESVSETGSQTGSETGSQTESANESEPKAEESKTAKLKAGELKSIGRLRNGDPLILSQSVGKGELYVFLTTASPRWNNWGRGNPSFVVVLQQLQGLLSQRQTPNRNALVGETIELLLPQSEYDPRAKCVLPTSVETLESEKSGSETSRRGTVAVGAGSVIDEGTQTDIAATADQDVWKFGLPNVGTRGVYRFLVPKKEDQAAGTDEILFAVNPIWQEGDLRKWDFAELSKQWPEIPIQVTDSSRLASLLNAQEGYNIQPVLIWVLVALLALESIVGCWAAGLLTWTREGKNGLGIKDVNRKGRR